MQKQTITKENFTSNTPNSVEGTPKSTYLEHNEQILKTPFVLRWRHEKGWFLTIGSTRITEPTPSREETEIKLTENMWELIAGMIVHCTDLLLKNPDMKTTKESNK